MKVVVPQDLLQVASRAVLGDQTRVRLVETRANKAAIVTLTSHASHDVIVLCCGVNFHSPIEVIVVGFFQEEKLFLKREIHIDFATERLYSDVTKTTIR